MHRLSNRGQISMEIIGFTGSILGGMFDANWAKRAKEVIEITASVVAPVKINVPALDFQDGI